MTPRDGPGSLELEDAARERLPPDVFDYYAGGADDETTLRANRDAFGRYALRRRVMVDVSSVDPSIDLLGTRLPHPILLAPTAFQRLAHPDGETATVRGAGSTGALYVASTLSTTPLEEIAEAATGPLWFQLYVYRSREITAALVRRAEAAGYAGICLTVTVPVQGNRERDARNRFRLPASVSMANFDGLEQERMPDSAGSGLEALIATQFDPSLGWDAIDWIRSITRLPVIVKGIVEGEDAALAVEHGAAGVIVSNHGGRQLDCEAGTLVALPGVVEAVAGRAPVLIDGGVRRGTDVAKALALGARAVLIGRPYLWGLAMDGEAGVAGVVDRLRHELERTMALMGCPTIGALEGAVTRV